MKREFNVEIGIINNGILYLPLIVDGVTLTSHYRGVPSELNFTVIKDDKLNFEEGNQVYLKFNGEKMFFGYVFEKQRTDGTTISVKAYDQVRYLQSRDSIEIPPMKASEYVEYIARRIDLQYDENGIEDTKVLLSGVVEEGTSYIDMILNALDRSRQYIDEEYVFYDNCGKLSLKNIVSLKSKVYIYEGNIESFSYTTSIDKETYTRVRFVKSNGHKNDDIEHVEQNDDAVDKWGVLVYYEQLGDEDVLKAKADEKLRQYCKRTVNLSLKNVLGYTDVRGGSCVFVDLSLGDMDIKQYFAVTRCTHNFVGGGHFMTLDVKGGIIGE